MLAGAGVEDCADHSLVRAWQLADLFELLLHLWNRAALGGLGVRADQTLDAAERLLDALSRCLHPTSDSREPSGKRDSFPHGHKALPSPPRGCTPH